MVENVEISYDGLWHILLERKMRKQDLKEQAQLTSECIAKLGRCESVHLKSLIKICQVLDCGIEDIVKVKLIKKGE